jgi:hypothetical protein
VLAALIRLGVDGVNGMSIVAFATSPKAATLTSVYSSRLAVDFGGPYGYLAAIGRSTQPAALLAWLPGGSDELYFLITSRHCSSRRRPICPSRSCPAWSLSDQQRTNCAVGFDWLRCV